MSLQPRAPRTDNRIPNTVLWPLTIIIALLILGAAAITYFGDRGHEITKTSYEATYGATDAKLSTDGSKVNFTKDGTYHECLTPKDEDFGKPLTCFTATTVNPASSR